MDGKGGSVRSPLGRHGRAIAIGLATVVPVMLLGLIGYRAAERAIIERVVHGNQAVARVAGDFLVRDFQDRAQLASAFASLPSTIDAAAAGDRAAMQSKLRVLVETYPRIERALAAGPDGMIWSDYPHAPESGGVDFSYREWFQGVLRADGAYVSGVYRRHAEPQPLVVAVAAPIRDGTGGPIAVLMFQMRLETLSRYLLDVRAGEAGIVYLVDPGGRIAAHPRLATGVRIDGPAIATEMVGGFEAVDSIRTDPATGERVIASVQPVQIGDRTWTVVAQQPTAVAFGPLGTLRLQLIVGALVLSIGGALLTGLLLWTERHSRDLEGHLQRREADLRTRDAFLSIAAHELRTPLTTLQLQFHGLAELSRRGADPGKLQPRVQAVEGQIRRIGRLVNNLLDISRIHERRMVLHPAPLDLGALVGELVLQHQGDAHRAGSSLEHAVAGDVRGRWDRARLEQVIGNLLGNAIKYGDGKPVEVRVADRGATVALEVRDRGIGIPAGDRARIFERFERVPGTGAAGFGLGLWIVQEIVQACGGSIEVDSRAGDGSTFRVVLPREPPPAPHDPA